MPSPGADSPLDEPTLLRRAQAGDLAALEALLRRHQGAMYRLALRVLGDPDDAEDAVQEAMVSAWRRLGTFRGDAAFSSWLYRIVTNRCLNVARSRSRAPILLVDPFPNLTESRRTGAPEAAAEIADQLLGLRQSLAALPADQRVCWVLRESEGLGYDEISHIVGASPDAVRGRIHRARLHLAEMMRPWQ